MSVRSPRARNRSYLAGRSRTERAYDDMAFEVTENLARFLLLKYRWDCLVNRNTLLLPGDRKKASQPPAKLEGVYTPIPRNLCTSTLSRKDSWMPLGPKEKRQDRPRRCKSCSIDRPSDYIPD